MKTYGNLKHGETINYKASRLYLIWRNIIYRTSSVRSKRYKDWGGRGIKLCDEWRIGINFINWAKSHGYKENLQIDRIDNNKNYCPENCRFVTASVNAQNRRKRYLYGLSKRGNSYQIGITREGKKYFNGSSTNLDEAFKLRDELLLKLNSIHEI